MFLSRPLDQVDKLIKTEFKKTETEIGVSSSSQVRSIQRRWFEILE